MSVLKYTCQAKQNSVEYNKSSRYMTSFKHRQKIRKVNALNVIYKSIIYKLRNKDVTGKRSSVLLSIVIFFIIFVCLFVC